MTEQIGKGGVSTGVGDRLRTAQDAGSIFVFLGAGMNTIHIFYILCIYNTCTVYTVHYNIYCIHCMYIYIGRHNGMEHRVRL